MDVSVNGTNQHFYSEFFSDKKCLSQENSSLSEPIKTCSFKSEKDSAFEEYCRKKRKLMNNQTDVSINNVNHQFCNGSLQIKNANFPHMQQLKMNISRLTSNQKTSLRDPIAVH